MTLQCAGYVLPKRVSGPNPLHRATFFSKRLIEDLRWGLSLDSEGLGAGLLLSPAKIRCIVTGQWLRQVNGSRLEKTERHQSENYDFGTQRRILEAQKHHALNIVKKDLREVASRLKAEQTQPTTARTPSF